LATFATPPLPLRTVSEAAEWLPQTAHIRFGDSLELVSYEIDPQPEQGILHVNLAWQSLKAVNESYLLQVELVNSDDRVVSHWIGYNGNGRLPSLAWDPGDSIFDRLTLPVPELPAGEYRLYLRLVGRDAPRPVESESDGKFLLTQILLSEANLPPSIWRILEPQGAPQGVQMPEFSLWRASGPTADLDQLPVYRYPATISVLLDNNLEQADISVNLIDPQGQAWSPTQYSSRVYSFVIGPRWPSGDYQMQIEWLGDGPRSGQITSSPVLTVENWWERHFEPPQIAVPLQANFADQIKLLGYKLPKKQVKAGEAFPVTLYWQALPDKSPQADFIQFNHLLDEAGRLQGGYDRRPLEYYSTLLWAPGEVVVDGYAVPVDADAPPGIYYLDVGFYLTVGESAVNLPLVVDGERSDITSVAIGPIEVVRPR
jgi:hypothetical protein